MPEWFNEAASIVPIPAGTMALRMILAVVFGAAVAAVYRFSHGRNSRDARTLTVTLVLLCVLLAMVSMVIGESIARAFGLVGALSIVRFRTVVEDTRDTAFVIFAVIVGMAVGTGLIMVPLIGIPVVAGAAIAMSRYGAEGTALPGSAAAGPPLLLTVRMGLGHDPATVLNGSISQALSSHRLVGVTTARQGSAIDVTYSVTLAPTANAAAIVQEINTIDGVQSVELREAQQDG
jgi:hypothetical protein